MIFSQDSQYNDNCLWCHLPITSDDAKIHEAHSGFHRKCYDVMEEFESEMSNELETTFEE